MGDEVFFKSNIVKILRWLDEGIEPILVVDTEFVDFKGDFDLGFEVITDHKIAATVGALIDLYNSHIFNRLDDGKVSLFKFWRTVLKDDPDPIDLSDSEFYGLGIEDGVLSGKYTLMFKWQYKTVNTLLNNLKTEIHHKFVAKQLLLGDLPYDEVEVGDVEYYIDIDYFTTDLLMMDVLNADELEQVLRIVKTYNLHALLQSQSPFDDVYAIDSYDYDGVGLRFVREGHYLRLRNTIKTTKSIPDLLKFLGLTTVFNINGESVNYKEV